MSSFVPLMVAIPLAVGFLIPLAIRLHPRLAEILSNITFLGLLLLSVLLTGHDTVYHVGGWPTPYGIDLRVDGLSGLMLLSINSLAVIVGLPTILFYSSIKKIFQNFIIPINQTSSSFSVVPMRIARELTIFIVTT